MLAGPPLPRVDDQVADVPVGIVDKKVLNVSDLAVDGVDSIVLDLGNAA